MDSTPHNPGIEWLTMPKHWPAQIDLLTYCQTMSPGVAAILIAVGLIYLLCGIYLVKVLVTLNAALVGMYFGIIIGLRNDTEILGGVLGAFIGAAAAWPLLKYAVAVMGGIYGAVLGASLWRAFGGEPGIAWAGALTGLVLFGLLSFVLFRASVMMYTSLQGSVMLVFGVLGLIYKYHQFGPTVTEKMTLKPHLLPMLIFIPTIVGLIYQQAQFGQQHATGGQTPKK